MGARRKPVKGRTGMENVFPIQPNVPVSRPLGGGDIGVGGGPGIPPRFPRGGRPRRKGRRPSFENLPPEQQKEITERRNQQMKRRGRRMKSGRRMLPRGPVTGPGFPSDGPSIMPIPPRPLTGGYNPRSGVRYTDQGVPTAVQETRRIPVQDPTLGGPPEREVPIPKERLPRITRESDPRGGAPFSPDEKGMARDRFFERMFDRADEKRQQRDMEREEFRETRKAERDERRARRNDSGEIDIDAERGGRGRRRRRGGMRRNRRGRRRDFTRRRSRMEGGRRGRSREERAAFRDRYVSTLR